jgi:hypothetical protein
LNEPVVGMAATPDGAGYWLVASDGGIFSFGDAVFHGSTGAIRLNQPVVGMAATPDGGGYWLVASDGGIFSFGDAVFCGSTAGSPTSDRIVGMQADVDGTGYSLIGEDGTVYSYRQAGSSGPRALNDGVSQVAAAWLRADVERLVAAQAPDNPNGLWIGGDPVHWRSSSGPALAAGAVARLNGDSSMLEDAKLTFDSLIARHEQPNGSFSAVGGTVDPQSPDIDTMFFVTNLGMALWALRTQLAPSEVSRWTAAITAGADFLVANGNLSYYTNGNIAVGNALVMALAYWATGDTKYKDDYDTALAFALDPPESEWQGFGFVYTKAPTQPDGSDGAGYFAESSGTTPGFDPDYTQLQLDQLVRLYLVTASPEILRLVNLEFNQEWPRVDTGHWTLDTSGGSRHAQTDRFVPFTTPALAMLAVLGGRHDLVGSLDSQVQAIETSYGSFVTNWSPGGLYGFGVEAASLVLMGEPG